MISGFSSLGDNGVSIDGLDRDPHLPTCRVRVLQIIDAIAELQHLIGNALGLGQCRGYLGLANVGEFNRAGNVGNINVGAGNPAAATWATSGPALPGVGAATRIWQRGPDRGRGGLGNGVG